MGFEELGQVEGSDKIISPLMGWKNLAIIGFDAPLQSIFL